MIETTINGNNLLIYQNGELTYNSAVNWYTDYARLCSFIGGNAWPSKWITEDYLNHAEAMGWR